MADVLICVGYDMQEFDPARINPNADKKIIHISRYAAEVDPHYPVSVGIESNIPMALDELAKNVNVNSKQWSKAGNCKIQNLLIEELEEGHYMIYSLLNRSE